MADASGAENLTFVYDNAGSNPTPPPEPDPGEDPEQPATKTVTLTIEYYYKNGQVAAPAVTIEDLPGKTIRVPSPALEFYSTADTVVERTLQEDETYVVVYEPERYSLTLHYVDHTGNEIAPPTTFILYYGEKFVRDGADILPAIPGYRADREVIDLGSIKGPIEPITIHYAPLEYTVSVVQVDPSGNRLSDKVYIFPVLHGNDMEIDLSALRHNWHTVNAHVREKAPDCRVIAVVKANAYGHGAEIAARTLREEGCDIFAVSCVYEAASLREILGDGPDILLLGYSLPEDAQSLWEMNIIQTIFSLSYAREMEEEMCRLIRLGILPENARLRTHLKLDTGMNRLGIDACNAHAASADIREILSLPHLSAEGMFTHFACADEDRGTGMSALQLSRFEAVEDALRKEGICPPFLHCCNSAGALHMPDAYKNGVRAGVILYGMSPDGSVLPDYRPVMTLKTRIAHIHTLRQGESVSYGAAFTAPRDMRIATLPIGYADGFVRHFAGASV
ncbi:MAG: alanine racemase, partial [Clostridia bacterium]|nr:alanine racemase [Clostridia bacterium]